MKQIMNPRLALGVILLLVFGLVTADGGDKKGRKPVTRLGKTATLEYQHFDGNRINSIMGNNGQYVSQVVTSNSGMEWPKGTFKLIDYAAGIWVAGKVGGQYRTAAAEYASEFTPGKILPSGAADDASLPQYRWYKITRADLLNPGDDYLNWPVADGAPVDSAGNPLLMGDITMWCVFNDMDAALHANIFSTLPLGIEVQFTAWGYDRPDAFGDMMFIKAKIIHKGTSAVDSTFIALWDDPDLGDSGDDYVGCDTTLSLGYCWNADNNDLTYGSTPPAIGRDFFQGPIIPSPGDTALVSGRRIPGYKNLPMYAFAYYINGSTFPQRDPENAEEAFNYMTGRYQDGSPFIDPMTTQPTRFVFPGDPVTSTGWSEINPTVRAPGDRRFLMSSGPFTFSPGDTQEVVFGVLIATGADNKSSVDVLKEVDKSAQTAYDINFALPPSPPVPVVTVTELDREVVFIWEDNAESYSAADLIKVDTSTGLPTSYDFEGYVVYQVDHPSSPTIVKTLATFDLDNMVLDIKDFKYDPAYGENVEVTVVKGTNSGLQRRFSTKMDAISGLPLVNDNPYYFVIAAYGYNSWGVPRMLKSAQSIITVRPHAAPLGTRWNSANGDTISAVHASGISDGSAIALVVDPTLLTGHDYEFTVRYDTANVEYLWSLRDVTTGTFVLQDQSNQSGDGTLPFVQGLQPKLIGPAPEIKEWEFLPDDADRWFTGVNWGGRQMSGGFDTGEWWGWGTSSTPGDLVKIEIRFRANADGQNAYRYARGATPNYAFQDYTPQHFTVWDVTANPDRQLNVAYVEQNGGPAANSLWQPTTSNADREYLFILGSDYSGATPDPYYTSRAIFADAADFPILYTWWPLLRPGHTAEWADGQILSVTPNFINTPADRFTFSTAGFQPTASTELAKTDVQMINVFPNPYFGAQPSERDPLNRYVTFTRLPMQENTKIRIFSLAGVLVRQIEHATGTTSERWDLRNTDGIPVASGMYLVHIEIEGLGSKILKLGVIQPEERLDRL
jgi:hypothetical protein